MKSMLIFLSVILITQVGAVEKNDTEIIAKGIQCTQLRDKSFIDTYEQFTLEKVNSEYIKKVSDSIYAQAFKICDPENSVNADKEIFTVCNSGCDQFVKKSLLGFGGSSTEEIDKCKKTCTNYSNILSISYVSASKALKKYIDQIPPAPKKIEPVEVAVPSQIAPVLVTTPTVLEKAKEDDIPTEETLKSEAAKLDAPKSDVTKVEAAKPAVAKAEVAKPEMAKEVKTEEKKKEEVK